MSDWLSRALDAVESQATESAASSASQVDDLRAAIMRDGVIATSEAARLMDLHRTGAPVTGEDGWDDLFVEALTSYFALSHEVPELEAGELSADWADVLAKVGRSFGLGRTGPSPDGETWVEASARLGVSAQSADVLVTSLGANGLLLDAVEMRLLARLFSHAVTYPAALRSFAWQALAATVQADRVITEAEAALVRALAMGPASEAGVAVTRQEAEMIIAINRACDPASKHVSWTNVFAGCMASHVLHQGRSPGSLDAVETAWLDSQLAGHSGPETEALDRFLAAA
ncbi:MAG: hypothetical protein MUF14_04285 [Hyphomonadaceae bacterium]|jgi:hypothetical protein|nr:hypothetical protein [Hyphomonadaceae bacterium]